MLVGNNHCFLGFNQKQDYHSSSHANYSASVDCQNTRYPNSQAENKATFPVFFLKRFSDM